MKHHLLKVISIICQTFIFGFILLLLEKSFPVFIFGIYDDKFGAWGTYSFCQFVLAVPATLSAILSVVGFAPFATEIRSSTYRELFSLVAIVQVRLFLIKMVSYCAIPILSLSHEWYHIWITLWWPVTGVLAAAFTAVILSSFKNEKRRVKFFSDAPELLRCMTAILAISMILFSYFIPDEMAVSIKRHSSLFEKLINPLFWMI